MNTETELKIAIRKAGGMRALARKIGVTYQAIQRWIAEDEVPDRWLIAIEKATGVQPHKLRPDLFRHYERRTKKLELA